MAIRIIGISGSLRDGSWNTRLLQAARERMPGDSELVVASIADVPLYNFDVEDQQDFPAAVRQLNDEIAGADGLLLSTPEYNNSVPGVLKNTVDWLSRRVDGEKQVFDGLPVALVGATPGGWGTQLAQAAWLPVMRTLNTRFWNGGRLAVSKAPSQFVDDGLADETLDKRLGEFLAGFVEYVREVRQQQN